MILKGLGADLNCSDFMGRTPLHEAAQQGHSAVVDILLKNGANPNAKDWRKSTPLHYACAAGQIKSTARLLKDKKTHASLQDSCGRTALMLSAYRNHHKVTEYLIQSHLRRLNPHATDIYGYSILHYTTCMEPKTVDILFENLQSIPKPTQSSSVPHESDDEQAHPLSYADSDLVVRVWYRRLADRDFVKQRPLEEIVTTHGTSTRVITKCSRCHKILSLSKGWK
jgi:ankyrin repeat protein